MKKRTLVIIAIVGVSLLSSAGSVAAQNAPPSNAEDRMGVCVIGMDSPCNGVQWGGTPEQPDDLPERPTDGPEKPDDVPEQPNQPPVTAPEQPNQPPEDVPARPPATAPEQPNQPRTPILSITV
ncbi:hypothetical protein [Haladaptatus caseinilyticus]|uniref:hypothetical protein n=1 Tax=Haladaptatus caseinilyticus TaxID=2993314 RepID=UPI00224B62A5|nr:hypothetical protein [Haladaptatus caseinilyticus]